MADYFAFWLIVMTVFAVLVWYFGFRIVNALSQIHAAIVEQEELTPKREER